MRFFPVLPALALGALAACQTQPAAPAPDATVTAVAGYDAFGEAIADTTALTVNDAAAQIATLDSTTVTVAGTVHEVCQKAGCWATLRTDDGMTMRVNVAKNDSGAYRFTMPKDISGRRVIATGFLEQTTLPADHAEHMAEESSAHDSTKVYTDARELRLTASGVLVRKA